MPIISYARPIMPELKTHLYNGTFWTTLSKWFQSKNQGSRSACKTCFLACAVNVWIINCPDVLSTPLFWITFSITFSPMSISPDRTFSSKSSLAFFADWSTGILILDHRRFFVYQLFLALTHLCPCMWIGNPHSSLYLKGNLSQFGHNLKGCYHFCLWCTPPLLIAKLHVTHQTKITLYFPN